MAKTFMHEVAGSPDDLLMRVKKKLERHPDIVLTGNKNRGEFRGQGFAGSYVLRESKNGTEISLNIREKPPIPWFVVKTAIKSELKKW